MLSKTDLGFFYDSSSKFGLTTLAKCSLSKCFEFTFSKRGGCLKPIPSTAAAVKREDTTHFFSLDVHNVIFLATT